MRSDNLAYEASYNGDLEFIDAEGCCLLAERRAADYFRTLYQQVTLKTFVSTLTQDFQQWGRKHIHTRFTLAGLASRHGRPDPGECRRYIRWLDRIGRLDAYLERSISYIFMRDLGKAPDSEETRKQVRRAADRLKGYFTRPAGEERENEFGMTDIAKLYRRAQKEDMESAVIWVIEKLKSVTAHLPEEMDAEETERKLIKIIAGVLMHQLEEMDDGISKAERSARLDSAIRLGYSYGLTYPFIDDLLDANILSPEEKRRYSDMIRTSLVTGAVPELGDWPGKNGDLVRYIHSELREAFERIRTHQGQHRKAFFEQGYVFFRSQEEDRNKALSYPGYTNEDLYIPVILKSSSSRLIARSITAADDDSGFDSRTFYYGIYNQLADDFADMFSDMKEGAVTPYTYYLKYHFSRADLVNPFELYWTVISNLIHGVYRSDPLACEVMLDRAVNGLKRFRNRLGRQKYDEIMSVLTAGMPDLNRLIQKMVRKADDVDFFDKLVRDSMLSGLKKEKAERDAFEDTINSARRQINGTLHVSGHDGDPLLDGTLLDAANYSITGDGKRIRPIAAWVMGRDAYGLEPDSLLPLLRSLEYMHTASLIFDDLPSQDNSDMRRGLPTLHRAFDIATAELTGLLLTQKAVEEQASLGKFQPEAVLRLIRYSSGVTQDMCRGQAMDLESRGRLLTLEHLKTICFYKTGIAFEASLIMPAILAGAGEDEMEALKGYAYHTGIAFQIRDDLLDAEGNMDILGKPAGKDADNNNTTFVKVLGTEGARKEMWNQYCRAMEALRDIPRDFAFLRQLLRYIVCRDH